MHPFSLVVFLTLAAGPASQRTIPAGCREDHGTCREDCTIDYGGSTTKYRQLLECIQRCDKEQQECTTQHYSLQDAQLDPLPQSKPEPVAEPEPASKPAPDEEPAPAPRPEPKPAETQHPPSPETQHPPPPEPKKKDISEWDPDAD